MGAASYEVWVSLSIEMMLNSGNNAFYGVFIPLHYSLGFPSVILERWGHLTPLPPWIHPCSCNVMGPIVRDNQCNTTRVS